MNVLDPAPAKQLWTPDGTILDLDDIAAEKFLRRHASLSKIIGDDAGGGGGGGRYVEVASQEVTGAAVDHVLFDDLDGDTDICYAISGIVYSAGGNTIWMRARFNGASTDGDHTGSIFYGISNTANEAAGVGYCPLVYLPGSQVVAVFDWKVAAQRLGSYEHTGVSVGTVGPGWPLEMVAYSTWHNTADNITSIEVAGYDPNPDNKRIDVGSIFTLYKLVHG